ncbi:glycoside hydrolase family 31 protein [Cohnella silvisoli]|uniref:Glycoside hydrolase family 31 protein n=1 Tax=Cohnella silvisoli TaxID=2873699 RepID=A0ABV1L3F1_9BACL|nr:glycoside hydrolase family 31 protein [Cohnella silvisoli]MCD9026201.1 glycoside hydrolase family 31 protein [Cohnella silvisoli]
MSVKETAIELFEQECWWGGAVNDGVRMPFNNLTFERDLSVSLDMNQGVPFLISNRGRYIWSDAPFRYVFNKGILWIWSKGDIQFGQHGSTLKEAFQFASGQFFPPDGAMPEPLLFQAPQYNLWIEMMYEPSQDKVIAYAQQLLQNGFPPGVLMIDDNWHDSYGSLEFHPGRFPDPAVLTDTLHRMGFQVMLWVSPFITPDTVTFRMLQDKGYLLKDRTGETAIRKWWSGYSALLDCTNAEAVAWFRSRLNGLMSRYGIDGFKFDGGDPEFYEDSDLSAKPADKNRHCETWGEVGLSYSLNEYRACWKLAGRPIVQRLKDKYHQWEQEGLATLIPCALAQGLAGYAFNCPDMIGGGDIQSFIHPDFSFDEELFVRYAQCSALFPMMQFSAAPWRLLNEQNLFYCVEAARLHLRMGDRIVALAEQSSLTGEPIMRAMDYVFPGQGYERIHDQFLLGDEILVAPVLEKGAVKRKVVIPDGRWMGDDGIVVTGPCEWETDSPLSRLPWYEKIAEGKT